MAAGSVLKLPHLPNHEIHVSLFKDVANAPHIRQQLIAGNSDFEYAFLDASKIISVNHALAAVFRALNDSLHNRLKSRNMHSEVVFSLSPNNNIADSFRHFGISDKTTNLLAIKIIPANADVSQQDPSNHLASVVEGTRVEFNDDNLRETADLAQVRKLYKLNASAPVKPGKRKLNKDAIAEPASTEPQVNGSHGEVDKIADMEAVIIGIMALKGS